MENIDVSVLKKIDIETTTFLNFFNKPILQGLSHNKKSNKSILKDYTNENLKLLLRKNQTKELGIDLYFTPNGRFGGKEEIRRTKESGQCYDWIVFDFDSENSAEVCNYFISFLADISAKFSLDKVIPNFIVKTFRGYHLYYKLEDHYDNVLDDNINIYNKTYKIICSIIEKEFSKKSIDTQTKDISRLFRLPNSIYRKKETKEDITTDVIFMSQSSEINLEELYKAVSIFNKVEEKKQENVTTRHIDTRKYDEELSREIVDEKVNAIPIREILDELGYRYEGKLLFMDNEPSSGWVIHEKNNKIVDFSHTKERPGGNCIQFITMHFKGNLRKVYEFINDRLGINCNSILNYTPQEINVSFEDGAEIVYEETLGTIKLYSDLKKITYIAPKGIEQVATNFTINILGKIKMSNGQIRLLIQLETTKYKSRAIILPTESSPAQVNKYLRQEGAFDIRITSSKFINLLTLWFESKTPYCNTINIVNSIKYLDDGSYVGGSEVQNINGDIIYPDENTMLLDNNIVNLNIYEDNKIGFNIPSINKEIGIDLTNGKDCNFQKKDFKNLVLEILPRIYEERIIIPLFLSIINSLFSDFYYSNKIKFPHVIVWGETRSGKTEILTFIKRLIGFKDTGGIGVSSMTPFPFLVAGSTGIPIHLTEWTNSSHYSDFIQIQAKDSYDFRDLKRGTATQDIKTYKMKSNIIFDGEEMPTQDALQTRSIICFFKKNYKKEIDGNFSRYINNIVAKNKGLINYIINSCYSLFKDYKEYLLLLESAENRIYDYAVNKQKIKRTDDVDRIIHNFSQLLIIYEQLAKEPANDFIFECICSNFGETVKNNIQFDSSLVHITNLFSPLINSFHKPTIARGLFDIDFVEKTININRIMVMSYIGSHKSSSLFDISCSFLMQNGFIEEQNGILIIDLKNKKNSKFETQWKGLVASSFSTGVIIYPENFTRTKQAIDYLFSSFNEN